MKASVLTIVSILVLLLVGCKTDNKLTEKEYTRNLEIAFVDGFKTLTLCKCLEYAHDKELKLWEEDVDCRTPDYLYFQSDLIDSLARQEAEKIKYTEATRDYPRAEGMEGKRILSSCLEFYNSKELSSIVRQRYAAQQ